MNRYWF